MKRRNSSTARSSAAPVLLEPVAQFAVLQFASDGSVTTTGGTTNAAGATFNTTGTINGGLTNSGTVIGAGAINGGITNLAFGAFTVTGNLTTNGAMTNSANSTLTLAGGDFTGLTTLTNDFTSASAVSVFAGRTLGATTIANNAGTFTNDGTVTTTGGTTNAAGATFNTTGTVNGGLTNSGTVNAAGAINSGITNQALGPSRSSAT